MRSEDKHRYDDIINLPHPTSAKHPRMPAIDRAAQFSPFAALTGYDAAVKETARLTDQRIELDEYAKAALDERLRIVQDNIREHPEVTVTFFLPDERKAGGAYVDHTGCVKKVDTYQNYLVMIDGAEIPIYEIIDLQGELFRGLDDNTL